MHANLCSLIESAKAQNLTFTRCNSSLVCLALRLSRLTWNLALEH